MRPLETYLLPELIGPQDLAGATVCVIDVLRASTTIVHALEAGAREVVPLLEVDQARAEAERRGRRGVVLGGERAGLPIDGFHLGNAPEEYTETAVGGRSVLFTTTNGTRALLRCRQAAAVLIGCFVNRAALVEAISPADRIVLLCAGTNGEITREDALAAGAIAERLLAAAPYAFEPSDQTLITLDAWRATVASAGQMALREHLAGVLRHTAGGRNLIDIGRQQDLAAAAAVDGSQTVPRFDLQTLAIAG